MNDDMTDEQRAAGAAADEGRESAATPGSNGADGETTGDGEGAAAEAHEQGETAPRQPAKPTHAERAPDPSPAAQPSGPPSIILSPPSIFRDRELTPVEATRAAVSSAQPKPWEPTDEDLDPNRDDGWERAASHELIAVRPEDIVTPPVFGAVLSSAGAPARSPGSASAASPSGPTDGGSHALPTYDPAASTQRYVAPATSVLAWSKPGSAGTTAAPSVGSTPAGSTPAGSAATAGTTGAVPQSSAFSSFTPAATPLLTPLPSAAELTAAGAGGTAPLLPATSATPGVATPARDVATPRRLRVAGVRRRARAGTRMIARPVMLMVLFVLGIVLGSTVWTRSQPPPRTADAPAAAATREAGTTDVVPPQIQSLVVALASDDQSQIQLVVPAQPYRLLAGELAVDGITRILGARALSTYTVGPDSATEILVTGDDGQGNALTFNLVVHLHNGAITDFR